MCLFLSLRHLLYCAGYRPTPLSGMTNLEDVCLFDGTVTALAGSTE